MLLAQNSRRAADRKAPIPKSWCTGKTHASHQGRGPGVSASIPAGMASLRQAIRAGLQVSASSPARKDVQEGGVSPVKCSILSPAGFHTYLGPAVWFSPFQMRLPFLCLAGHCFRSSEFILISQAPIWRSLSHLHLIYMRLICMRLGFTRWKRSWKPEDFAVNRNEWLYFMLEKSMDWSGHKEHWGSYADPWHSAVGAFGGSPRKLQEEHQEEVGPWGHDFLKVPVGPLLCLLSATIWGVFAEHSCLPGTWCCLTPGPEHRVQWPWNEPS